MSDKCDQLLTVSGGFHFWIGKVLAEVAVYGGVLLVMLVFFGLIWWSQRTKS